jgi:hypothetical protein
MRLICSRQLVDPLQTAHYQGRIGCSCMNTYSLLLGLVLQTVWAWSSMG